jgi:heme-degrading monooxygenase HmoA
MVNDPNRIILVSVYESLKATYTWKAFISNIYAEIVEEKKPSLGVR